MKLKVLNLNNLQESFENIDGIELDVIEGEKCVPYVVKSNDVFCEEEIALIFASYYSDQKFDNMVRSYNMNNTTN